MLRIRCLLIQEYSTLAREKKIKFNPKKKIKMQLMLQLGIVVGVLLLVVLVSFANKLNEKSGR